MVDVRLDEVGFWISEKLKIIGEQLIPQNQCGGETSNLCNSTTNHPGGGGTEAFWLARNISSRLVPPLIKLDFSAPIYLGQMRCRVTAVRLLARSVAVWFS